MEVVNTGRNVMDMLNELLNDLNRDDLSLIERLPYVREYERYRDVITNILREFHIALVLVRLTFNDGSRKGYVFLIKGEGGELGKIPTSGTVEGYVVSIKGNDRKKLLYSSVAFNRLMTSPQGLWSSQTCIERLRREYHSFNYFVKLRRTTHYSMRRQAIKG